MKNLILLALLIIMYSCSKDDQVHVSPIIECLGSVEVPLFLSGCDDIPLNEHFCETSSIGEFELEALSKEYMVYACNDIGDKLEYFNENGEMIAFEIIKNEYRKTISLYPIGKCQLDVSKSEGICLNSEIISLGLKSNSPELELNIEIKTIPYKNDDGSIGVGDFLQILRRTGENSFLTGIFTVLSKRSLDIENSFFQEDFETIEILGEEFFQVISNTSSTEYIYYFNSSEGLIGFKDKDGIVWKRK